MYVVDLYGESDNPEGARRVQQTAIKPCSSKQLQLSPPKDFSNQLRRFRLTRRLTLSL